MSRPARRLAVALRSTLVCWHTALPCAAAAQGSSVLVVGVSDVTNGAPLSNADVTLPDIGREARTDWIGEARFAALSSGTYRVRVHLIGYALADLTLPVRGDSAGVHVALEPAARILDAVTVSARPVLDVMNEFEARRRRGTGRFLAADQLEQERGQDFALVAAQHFLGLQVIVGRGGQRQLASGKGSCGTDTSFEVLAGAVRRAPVEAAGDAQPTVQGSCFSAHPCHVKLFLDNLPLAEADIGIVKTEDLYGVEYYSNGEAPPRYRVPGAACGVMLLWSKGWSGT